MQGGIAFFVGAGKPLRKTPFKAFGAQDKRGMGWPFLWILSFGHAKESIAVAGPRTGVKSGFAIAKQYSCKLLIPRGHKNRAHHTRLSRHFA
ncbi:hypothetical protein A1359_08550 [Methylomonas lenta]|uniref:Uncharacterized protein n=1 Tax=Methylomonas lenta TaxID=980561 RepID=A0A177NGQ8_9GAMM|nr:hypothetical protein A1359_08550 [Methylomonas lenta]